MTAQQLPQKSKNGNMNDFQEYLEEKYDHIERYDNVNSLYCLKTTEDVWKVYYELTLFEALKVWQRAFG